MLDLFLPERCAVCASPGTPLCDDCRGAFVRLVPPTCARCGAPTPWPVLRCAECAGRRVSFSSARSAIAYDERARAFVHEWKQRGRRRLGREAAAVVASVVPRPDVATLTWVPGDPERSRVRGDVPPRALAAELGALWELASIGLLSRSAGIPRQRGLRLADRRKNIRGAFVASQSLTGRLCLVDDVYTSGATADACAQALRRCGAERVEVVTLARAVR